MMSVALPAARWTWRRLRNQTLEDDKLKVVSSGKASRCHQRLRALLLHETRESRVANSNGNVSCGWVAHTKPLSVVPFAENQPLFLRVPVPGPDKIRRQARVLQACFTALRLVLLLYRMQDDADAGNCVGWWHEMEGAKFRK